MKPDREQWNIATLCNLGIYSVLYDNCVWLKMSVITDVVCYRLCFMILKNGILLRVQGWDVLRGREWDLQMTPRSRVLSVKFRFISYCRVFLFFFYAVSGDTFFFLFDKFTDRLYFKKKSQVYLRLLMFTGLQFCSLLGDWGFLRERASSQATKRLSLCSLFSS